MNIIIATFLREDRVKAIPQIPKELHDKVHLFTRQDRVELLRKYMPAGVHIHGLSQDVDGVADTRQQCIEQLPKGKVWFIDDQCVFGRRLSNGRVKGKLTEEEFMKLYSLVEDNLDNYLQVGISARFGNNRILADTKENTRSYSTYGLRTDWMQDADIRFDEMWRDNPQHKFYEDYWITLDSLTKGYPNLVIYNYFFSYEHNVAGGNSRIRTKDLTEASAKELQRRFPKYVTLVRKEGSWGTMGMSDRIEPRIQWTRAYQDGQTNIGQ